LSLTSLKSLFINPDKGFEKTLVRVTGFIKKAAIFGPRLFLFDSFRDPPDLTIQLMGVNG